MTTSIPARLLAYLLFLGVPLAGTFLFVVVRWASRRRRVRLGMLAAIFAAVLALVIIQTLLARPDIVQAKIETPRPGEMFDKSWISVSGTVSKPNAKVFVLVHPCTAIYWWVQPSPIVIGQAWTSDQVNLGEETTGKECFQIVALASTRPIMLESLGGWSMAQGDRIGRPPPLSQSEIVTVWRRPK
jgi:hypothetical protein